MNVLKLDHTEFTNALRTRCRAILLAYAYAESVSSLTRGRPSINEIGEECFIEGLPPHYWDWKLDKYLMRIGEATKRGCERCASPECDGRMRILSAIYVPMLSALEGLSDRFKREFRHAVMDVLTCENRRMMRAPYGRQALGNLSDIYSIDVRPEDEENLKKAVSACCTGDCGSDVVYRIQVAANFGREIGRVVAPLVAIAAGACVTDDEDCLVKSPYPELKGVGLYSRQGELVSAVDELLDVTIGKDHLCEVCGDVFYGDIDMERNGPTCGHPECVVRYFELAGKAVPEWAEKAYAEYLDSEVSED